MKTHSDIYSERIMDASWNVVQAATLVREARARNCSSLILYAGLEMRMGIEQLFFSIISLAKGSIDDATLSRCRRRDELRTVLSEVAPDYTLRCRFASAVASVYPDVPAPAEWNVGTLIKHYVAINELCHSPFVFHDMARDSAFWERRITRLEEAYVYLADGMRRGTGMINFEQATSFGKELWELFRLGKIDLDSVKARMRIMKPGYPRFIPPSQGVVTVPKPN